MKLPPQNIEAEESFLSACLLDCREEVADLLEPQDFYKDKHRRIFKAITKLIKLKQPIDLTTVYTEIKNDSEEIIGIAQYLAHLVDEVPIAPNLEHYAKMIKTAATGRKLITTAQKIQDQAFEITVDTVDSVLDEAQKQIMSVGHDIDDKATISFADLCLKRIGQYEELAGGKILGLKTGFHSLDYLTGGFWGSKLIVIAARPRVGKTAIMLNMAKNMASCSHYVGIFSIEMDKEELIDRQIASLSGINSIRLSTASNLGLEDWKKINEAAEKIYSLPIYIDDTGGLTIQELKRRARKMVKQGIQIIFIDQLSKIRGGQGRSEYEQRSFIVNELATLKKELRIPICLLCQINRKADDRPDKRPALSDLKSTGSIEEDADIVLLGNRPFLYTKDLKDEGKATWELAKHRQGPTRTIDMMFEEKTTTFYEVTNTYN